ncbi:hypothetical protein D3C85_838490 [compost metagenome]
MGLGGGQLHRVEAQPGKAVAQLGGAGEHHVVEGVVTQQPAQGGKHQAGIARLAAGEVAHFDDAAAGRTYPEAGFDGGLDGLLQILLQIEGLLTLPGAGVVEATGADQHPIGPVEPEQAGQKMGDAGVEFEGVGGLDISLQRHDLLRGFGQDQPVGGLDLYGHGWLLLLGWLESKRANLRNP